MGLFKKKLGERLMTATYTEDYHHVIQETYLIYIGASMSYGELMAREDVPFKFKSAVAAYILKDTPEEMTIGDHLRNMEKGSTAQLIYTQLKTKLTLISKTPDEKGRYESHTVSLQDFLNEELTPDREAFFIQEICVSKLALMTVS